MKKILLVINSFFLFLVIISKLYAEDLRDFSVGSSIELVSERGYINLKCTNDKEIFKWSNFKNCQKNSDGYYVISFEYDERFAVTEEYEGTQVAGHPVIINIAVDENAILQEININTDPNAPFYFKKQSHLLWMRVYSKYGGQNWECVDRAIKTGHIKIGKKYINRVCNKSIDSKLITIDYQFYFVGEKNSRDNLVSKSFLQIKFNGKV
tara:strand:- start:664 stop:1290 length:627 start_codon:yes stop_codon:yes gene_type:complete